MASTTLQPAFSGGEVAPGIYGRVDLAKYGTAVRTCENFIVLKHGGVANRPGLEHLFESADYPDLNDSSGRGRLIPFDALADGVMVAFVLDFTPQRIRFYFLGERVQPAAAAAWNAGTTYSANTYVTSGGLLYRALQSINLNNVPASSPLWWELDDGYSIESPFYEPDILALDFAQAGDVMTLVSTLTEIYELTRNDVNDWTLAIKDTSPAIDPPANLNDSGAHSVAAPTQAHDWVVTAIDEDGRESLISNVLSIDPINLADTNGLNLVWDAVAGAVQYNVYRGLDDTYGLIGVASSEAFRDYNFSPDYQIQPPRPETLIGDPNFRPAAVTYHDQRQVFAGGPTIADGARMWFSRTADFKRFAAPPIPVEDDAFRIRLAASRPPQIRAMVSLEHLLVLTSDGEWKVSGPDGGPLGADGQFRARQQSRRGTKPVRPVVVGNSVLYVQEKGRAVRDLRYRFEDDSYSGDDLSVLVPHIFANRAVVEWAWAEIPFGLVVAVLDDGTLAILTYLREHEIWAWHRHETDGIIESVCVAAEPAADSADLTDPDDPRGLPYEDRIYFKVKRTIDGVERRFLERFALRKFTDITRAFFVDAGVTYDGTLAANKPHEELVITGDPITVDEQYVMTGDAAGAGLQAWAASDVGDAVWATRDGLTIRFAIEEFISVTEVRVRPSQNVPASWITGGGVTLALEEWAMARDTISGLDHLEAKEVTALVDGNVAPAVTVSGAAATLATPGVVIHIGLPYRSRIETLDMTFGSEVVRDKAKKVSKVTVYVEESRGLWASVDGNTAREVKSRVPGSYVAPIATVTDTLEVLMTSGWSKAGRVLLEQRDPLPLTILSLMPEVTVGE